ncbi:apolipophorins isoform X1 [Poecilia latipinna]|uniref:apolipophorins isoform X1 n=1 Tax=Poecilia latipinna TaxID=48699 RepID=UPI00072DDB70|nr:PREDICTED: apolipophorins-like isoform X1 [Poecilia latipinna]
MAVSVLLLAYPHVILVFLLLHVGECLLVEPNICDTSCLGSQSTDFSAQKGVRYTYRYSAAISTTLHGSGGGRSGLALDCVVDIEAVSDCHLTMQIRNSQIKRLSSQREHSVLHLKTLRESLERTRLKFSLQGGKVTALCLQEGEQVWALNIKRALLSMLQTSPMVAKFREETETDVHGTCTSRYERRGPSLLKSRDLRQCQQSRLDRLWPHSVTLTEDTMVRMELHCVQRPGQLMVEEVNCTEVVTLAASLTPLGPVKTKSVSTLLLLKTQPGASTGAESLSPGVFTDLRFEDEGPSRPTSLQEVGRTIALLCSVASDPQLISQDFLELVFQLKDMTLPQLKTLWQESSFKCRNDWQPLLEALPACGSENCILLLTELVLNNELEEGQVNSFLTTLALIPHPSPQIIGSINGFLVRQELRAKAMLAGSSLIYQMCQRFQASCGETPQVQFFMQTIQETLNAGCGEKEPRQIRELIYALKSVGNSGVNAASFIPLLSRCLLGHQTELELKVAAVQAFRRFPCSADRSVLLQLYRCSREDLEVRIAAYQQLMLCPDQEVFEVVKTTLKNETSSQVGSFVWSHLTNILRSEDPVKQTLIQLLPDDIISRDFEAEFWKYSSYSDHTFVSGFGIKNLETSLIFSPKSFLPRSISANLTMYLHGRAHNLLEVDLHMENFEPLLRSVFGQKTEGEPTAKSGKQETRRRRRADDGNRREKETCLSDTEGYLSQARAMLFGRRKADEEKPRCRVSVQIFGNELSVFTCDDVSDQIHQGSLSLAGLAVKLLKGHEVHLSHRGVLMAEELRLPSLSGVPINLGINMTSLLSLHLKGRVNYRDTSHFSLNGYVRPNAYVGLSARMGVDGAPGQAAVEWLAELRSSPSLDGSFQLQDGREVRVTLNTPQDFMDVISLSSRVFQLSGDHREEMKGPKSRIQKTTCTPKSWSKLIGWQLCSNVSYPSLPSGVALPPTGPAHLSLRLLKLDRGLHYYLLEAAYSLHYKRGTWLPREASIHLLLATPQSSIPRDMSLDLAFSSHRVLLRIKHPQKTIVLQGQFDQEMNIKSGKLELIIDNVHFYIMGLVDSTSLQSEERTRYHLEAKMAADQRPVILSANITRGLGRKSSLSATLKNVFRETASLSVALERRQDLSSSSSQYSVEAELFLPGLVGSRMLGLMEQKGALWSSILRVKYGLRGDSRNLHQECYTSQRLRRGRDSNLTYIMRADHEFYCTNMEPINHKIHMKHEESPSHIKSVLDLSYGKHWDEINNKYTLLLSQSFKNQSTQNHTSYTLEFNLQVPEKNLNYRTQLMHSRLLQHGSESSTHLKINYNSLMPLVAGLHWKSPPENSLHKKWEGTFSMDTPGQYIYAAYRLSRPNRHALQLTSELTASKWLSIRNLVLDGFYRDRGREKAARLEAHTPAATYIQAEVWGAVEKQAVKAHGSLASLWTPPLKANVSLESSKSSHALLMSATCGRQNVSFTAAVSGADKNLKKRQAILKMGITKPKSPTMEVELEGWVEELRRDRKMYQKAAQLQFRQPFQNFPQTLLLRETFTVDLAKGLYILESKAGFHDNKEVIHTLTLGYKPPSPSVCSALIHTFSSDTFPSDSEVCVTATSNQVSSASSEH